MPSGYQQLFAMAKVALREHLEETDYVEDEFDLQDWIDQHAGQAIPGETALLLELAQGEPSLMFEPVEDIWGTDLEPLAVLWQAAKERLVGDLSTVADQWIADHEQEEAYT